MLVLKVSLEPILQRPPEAPDVDQINPTVHVPEAVRRAHDRICCATENVPVRGFHRSAPGKLVLPLGDELWITVSKEDAEHLVWPNVRAKPTAEADAGWPRKDNFYHGLKRPDGGCRSGSAP